MIFEYIEIEGSEEFKAERKIRQAQEYLNKTDWYIIRLMDTGQPVPQEVIESRQAARALI